MECLYHRAFYALDMAICTKQGHACCTSALLVRARECTSLPRSTERHHSVTLAQGPCSSSLCHSDIPT
eukprot:1153984-Pelagomonas_calceolata.AAC.3